MIEELIKNLVKAAKEEEWDYVDSKLPTVKDYKQLVEWSFNKGIHDEDKNIRDLGISIIEKADIPEKEFMKMRPQIFKLMISDPNPYVRFRSAFALSAHGAGGYSRHVKQALQEAEKDKDVRKIAKQYLKKF